MYVLGTFRPLQVPDCVYRCIHLWDYDRTMTEALEVAKTFLLPVDTFVDVYSPARASIHLLSWTQDLSPVDSSDREHGRRSDRVHGSCSGNETHVLPFLPSVFFPAYIQSTSTTLSLVPPTFILRFQSTIFLHFSTCPMSSSGLRRPSSSPSPSPGINIILPSSSHRTSVPPLTGGDLQAPVLIYQHNLPATNGWMPYNHGFGLPQGHANTVQFGNHGSLGRPGEYVTFSPP